jgi:hypothetical protein
VHGFHSYVDETSSINEDYISVHNSIDPGRVIHDAVEAISGKHVCWIYNGAIWNWSLPITCVVVSSSEVRPFSLPQARGRRSSESLVCGNVNIKGWLSSCIAVVDNEREWSISRQGMLRVLASGDGGYPSSLALLKSPSAIQHSNEGYESQSPRAEREALSSIGASIPTPLTKLAGIAAIAVASMLLRRFGQLALPVWLFTAWLAAHVVRWVEF